MEISIVTFISGHETFSSDFLDLLIFFEKQHIKTQAYVFVEKYNEEIPEHISQIVMPATTKYTRIMSIVDISIYKTILFIDNDITINKTELLCFINKYMVGDYALGWGRISTTINAGLVPGMIEIDKILSHNIIRPALWKMNIGVSLPGQIFILNKEYYCGNMSEKDTVYDDLALGVVTKHFNFPYMCSSAYLGTEMPKLNIKELCKQRRRWAQGFAETIVNNLGEDVFKYIIIHGIAYHFLLFFLWCGIFYLIKNQNYDFAIGLVILFSCVLSWGKVERVLSSFLYLCIFPFIHIVWSMEFFKKLIYGLSCKEIKKVQKN